MESLSFRNRLIIILFILSFTASIFIFAFVMNRVSIDLECTSHNQYTVDGSTIYFAQNNRKEGFLFSMNGSGRVAHLYSSRSLGDSRILSVSVYNGKIYLVQQTFIEEKSKEDENAIISIPAYRIVSLDGRLSVETMSPKFKMDDNEILTGFSAEGTGLFMTFVTKDGQAIKVYSISPTVLKGQNEKADDEVQIEGVRSKKCEDGRFYADAFYQNGQLYVRTDKSRPEGIFEIDPVVNNIVSGMKLSIGQIFSLYSTYIIWYVAALLIWFIVLYLIIRVLENRNRTFYYLVIAEAVLFAIVAAGTAAVCEEHARARRSEHSRFAVTSLLGLMEDAGLNEYVDYTDDAFYDSVRYIEIRNSLTNFVRREGNSDIFYDVLVMRLRDNIVCASASGRNKEAITDIYGNETAEIPTEISRGNRFVGEDIKIEGQNYRAVAVADNIVSADYALVGIINTTTTDATVFVDNLGVFVLFLVVWALGSALVVLIWFLHMRDLIVLEQALSDTALGKPMPERPAVLGRDIKDMWDSVAEMNKRVEEIQYSKLRILEAYYRFAPKNVEKILGKKSIIEVESGDYNRIRGTIGTFSFKFTSEREINSLDNLFGLIGGYQKSHGSILINKAADMSSMQMLFLEDERDTASSLVDAINKSRRSGDQSLFTVLLHYDACVLGVVGNEDESSIYMFADEKDQIKKMSAFAKSMDLGIVVSDSVIDREKINGKVRFIGYGGRYGNGDMIGLYEILDACPVKVRTARLNTLSKFNEALQLYYEKDFYFARTKFSEILKDDPDDKLAKWYVFESDRYLNESAEGDSYKLLHI